MMTGFTKNTAFEFIKKHKKQAILIGAVLILSLSVGGGIILQKIRPSPKVVLPEASPKTVELKLQPKKEGVGQTGDVPQAAAFLLKPSPEELLQQLTSLENFNEDVVEAKYTGLRVLWPVYFFVLQSAGGTKATLLLDAAEDGFGVVIESEVDTSVFPQLSEMEPGKKVWIGGEILTVDRSGTGTVYLKTEHLKFGDDTITTANRQPTN